ncbi:hypothetical protein FO470_02110 [Starkeya sp. 3C]|uniref:Uncharacterized protein n=1 Tax=Ancylobacter moscoviensis TaxID=2597768 RepID=A0ABY3DUU6_9HYPH|nr:hypothetical protein [Ancylobacter moscoviensis]TSJ64113.1 hypothetical protein FO470_02110 [Ancylobacter moscoviensis]
MNQSIALPSQPFKITCKVRIGKGRLHASVELLTEFCFSKVSVNYSARQNNRADECARTENGLQIHKQCSCVLTNNVCATASFNIELRIKPRAPGLPRLAIRIFDLIHARLAKSSIICDSKAISVVLQDKV